MSLGNPSPWTDNHGQSGSIDYLGAFHRQDYYYPAWVKEKQYTLRGTRLKERNYDQSGNGTYWVNDSYEWGYADNFSAIDRLTDDDNYNAGPSDNHFKISHAVTFDGKDANLKYIDFIKVQVGVNSKSGAVIFTAASASLPIPFPTNIPSVITNRAENTIPSTVGISNLRNNVEMFILPKSILSFITFYLCR